MPVPTTITAKFDAKTKVYTLTSTSAVIPSGGPVTLKAEGADSIPLTASTTSAPFGHMTATTAGANTALHTDVLGRFTLTVVAAGCTSNTIPIAPQFSLTLSSAGGTPDPLDAGPGASVAITAVVGTVTTSPGDLFVGETSSDTISMSNAVQAFTVSDDAATGDYDLSEPDDAHQIPLKGKIRISSSTGAED